MGLQKELGLINPFMHKGHETVLNIVLTGTLLAKEGNRILQPFGLTDAQFNVLMLLKYQASGGRINQTNLGNMMLVNRSNITGLIDRMEKSGLVRRISDPEDRRVNHVEITDKGSRILAKANKVYYARLVEVMSVLPKKEFNLFCRTLENVRQQLQSNNQICKHKK